MMRHQAKRLCKTNITLLHFLANKPRRELSGTRKNRKIFLHCRTELSKTRHSRKSSYSYSFIWEPYQTIRTVYFILGILRTDLWSQGTAPEGFRWKFSPARISSHLVNRASLSGLFLCSLHEKLLVIYH